MINTGLRHKIMKSLKAQKPQAQKLYSKPQRIAFIHIPKTGGTSMNHVLKRYRSKVRIFGHSPKAIHDKYNSYYKIAFVRNPYDRFLSTYLFIMNGGINNAHSPDNQKIISYMESNGISKFDDLCMKIGDLPELLSHHLFVPQAHWICKKSEIKCDFVGRFENIEKDWQSVKDIIGIDDRLPVLNATDHKHWSEYYSREAMSKIRKLYQEDFSIFNF